MAALANRMAHELRVLAREPPEGVSAAPEGDCATRLRCVLQGPPGTVYEGGWFRVSVTVPERFPFEPPRVRFDTRVYHPNIDSQGRVCLDLLDMPPKGSWRPSLTLATVLAGVRQLLADPNPRDPLEPDVTEEYLGNHALFELKARQMVARYATAEASVALGGGGGGEGAAAAEAGAGGAGAAGAGAAAAAEAPAAAAEGGAGASAAAEQEEGPKQQQQQQQRGGGGDVGPAPSPSPPPEGSTAVAAGGGGTSTAAALPLPDASPARDASQLGLVASPLAKRARVQEERARAD